MAVGLVVLFLEGALVQLLQAKRANKVFRMELAEHSSDAATCNGLVTTCTERSSFGMVVGLAVGKTLVVEERSPVEGLSAIPADEAFGVPLGVES